MLVRSLSCVSLACVFFSFNLSQSLNATDLYGIRQSIVVPESVALRRLKAVSPQSPVTIAAIKFVEGKPEMLGKMEHAPPEKAAASMDSGPTASANKPLAPGDEAALLEVGAEGS